MGNLYEDDEEESQGYARKFRPSSFDGYIGNTDVKETVMRYLKSKRRPQTALIKGNSGCGKTTLARIIAREYLCFNRDPERGACGECESCQMFERYIKTGKTEDLTDVYEINAADKSGKRDIDSMLESMEYPPIMGDWKIYILDEAHKLSEGAMSSLLKPLEEPPEGVFIILCTTNPEQLLDTIQNRCQMKLAIQKPTTVEIIDLLQRVCLSEGKEYDLEGLRMIVGRSDNVVRDSLNNLETVLATRGSAHAAEVSAEFKQVTDKIVYDFYKAYFNEDYVSYIDVLYRIKTKYGFDQFLTSLINFTLRGIYIINSINVEGLTKEELLAYKELFSKFTPQDISKVLTELRRMNLGSIEANLMSFIYCKGDRVSEVDKEIKIPEKVTIQDEQKFRNNNLQRLEQAKLDSGKSSIASEMEVVGISDMLGMFNLEKVSE